MKKEIIYFVDIFGWGGIETFICNICSGLDSDKFSIKIVAINKITDHFDALLESLNVELEVLVQERLTDPLKRFFYGLKIFKKYVSRLNDPIMHFNVSNAVDLLYVEIAKKNSITTRIVHCHNSDATNTFKKIAHYTLKPFLCNNATCKMACSDKAAKWLFSKKSFMARDYLLVRNSIPVNDYLFDANIRKEIRLREGWDEKFVIGHIGRFNVQKNHKALISIFEQIHILRSDSYLVLIGEGSLEEEIRQLVKDKNMCDCVCFYGMTFEVNKILQGMDLFILPSLYEGLPFVLVESQAASLPTLASDSITKEVIISDYIKYCSLNAQHIEWAKMAIELGQMRRVDNMDHIIRSGFGLDTTVQELEKIYLTL